MRFIWLAALVILTGVVGCGGGGGGGGSSTRITVSVVPDIAPLNTSEQQQFIASVKGTSNQAVNWKVKEGNAGGTITADGLYKAPPNAGTYHVEAISLADGSAAGVAIVTVTASAQTGSVSGTIQ